MDEAAGGDDFLYKTVGVVRWISLPRLARTLSSPLLLSQPVAPSPSPISSTILAVRRRVFVDSSDGGANEGILSGTRIG